MTFRGTLALVYHYRRFDLLSPSSSILQLFMLENVSYYFEFWLTAEGTGGRAGMLSGKEWYVRCRFH